MLQFAYGLENANPDPRGKIVQKWKILYINQNSNLSSKLNFTHQNEFGGMFVF